MDGQSLRRGADVIHAVAHGPTATPTPLMFFETSVMLVTHDEILELIDVAMHETSPASEAQFM